MNEICCFNYFQFSLLIEIQFVLHNSLLSRDQDEILVNSNGSFSSYFRISVFWIMCSVNKSIFVVSFQPGCLLLLFLTLLYRLRHQEWY